MKRIYSIGSVLFLVIFVFSLAAALHSEVLADTGPCCNIAASPDCSAGKGERVNGFCRCNVFNYPSCQHICPQCW